MNPMETVNYDVAVCGAGVAGCAAAIAAARSGMKTVLIEKQCLLGGLATSGLIYIYLPICDGKGHKVMGGIPEEMIKRCTAYSPFDLPESWGGPAGADNGRGYKPTVRYESCFSPAGFSLELDKMLLEAGVDLWLDTMITGCEMEGKRLTAIHAANSSGMVKITAGCFIDATGGAYVAQQAGCRVHRTKNFVSPWVVGFSEEKTTFCLHEKLGVHPLGALTEEYTVQDCSTGKSITCFMRDCWDVIRKNYDKLSPEERKKNFPVQLPSMPQLRKIAAVESFRNIEDSDCGKHFDDSIGVAGDWRGSLTTVWETPFGSLVPRDAEGLFTAGRCIGSIGKSAWEIYRVIPAAAMTGEAAGTAAAQAVRDNCSTHRIDVEKLRKTLADNKCILYYPHF